MSKRTKILVCGATGFIGRNIVEQLARNKAYEVHAVGFTRPRYPIPDAAYPVVWHHADLRNPSDVTSVVQGMDCVVHAAAATSGAKDIITRPYIHVTDNAVMTSYLLREAFEQKVKHFIFMSCTVMYQNSDVALKESDWSAADPLHPRYFGVGHTKMYVERMLEFFSGISDLKTTAIRHSNIYGPHDKYDLDRSHVFGATVTKVMSATDKVVVWGTGEEERDLLYVDDLVRFVEAALTGQSEKYRLYNCGLGKAVSIRDLVGLIVAASGKELKIEYDLSKPTIKTSLCLDTSLAKQELGWEPHIDLPTGIGLTLDWWRQHIGPQR